MDRREFLKLTGLGVAAGAFNFSGLTSSQLHALATVALNDETVYGGWVDDPSVVRYFVSNNDNPYLSQVNEAIRGTGAGQVALLWPFLEQITGGPFIPHFQEIGDCVSHGFGLSVDLLTALQILKRQSPQRWVAEAATEVIYGGGRIEVAKNRYGKNWWGDGMTGTVAAEFVKTFGILVRQKYLDKWDFSEYSGDLARQLGTSGVPDELEPLCRIHPVGCVTLVRSWDEARDCIYNGYPIALCSSQGFNTRHGRDENGFLNPSRRPWMHCMCLAGIDDNFSRPGGLIINSWGSKWISGPKRHNQPDGSFWADASVIDRMCKQGDSIALSCYAGYPRQDYIIW
jgi:hypothetical protein